MGNAQVNTRRAEYESAARAFSKSELDALKKLYLSLSAQSRSHGKYVSASVFQAYFGIRGSLGMRLFDLVTQSRRDQCLYLEDFVIAKAIFEKGSPPEIEDFMFALMDLTGDGKVQRTEVESVMLSILVTVLGPENGVINAGLPEGSIEAFLKAAEYSENGEDPCMSRQDFRKLCSLIPSIKRFLASLLIPQPMGIPGRHTPLLKLPEGVECYPLLRSEYAWHICGLLQQQECQEWMLLYHSSINGLSFNTFLGGVVGVGGPTILVIKDKQGCVFGGYASQPWERHSAFYGDMKCFVFTLEPQISLYRPSGANANLQWCASNYISESIPNGVGFGGQIHHFGLFLSDSFDCGHTHPSVTFGNPPLSKTEEIVPHTIECWTVVDKSAEDTTGQGGSKLKGTILERFKEDRNMLNLAGVANASDSNG